MIFVFVVDTSPTMARPATGNSGISRLDLAKMAIEDFIRQWRKMRTEHSRLLGRAAPDRVRCVMNLGQYTNSIDHFFLLSTARQHPEAAVASAARFVENYQQQQSDLLGHQQERIEYFQRELKGLQTGKANTESQDEINYATGLNAALSGGLQILSRYRLHNSQTENFGMGRLPNCAVQTGNGSPAVAALQPACLILVSDGACLRLPPSQGGGTLELQFGSQPLRELYREPFRWDQRIFVQAVGGREGVTSSQYLHPQLRALCEVTGGSHWMIRSSSTLSASTDMLLKCISPPMPKELPLPEPLYLKTQSNNSPPTINIELSFVNSGPVCCFQAFEPDESGKPVPPLRAMLLYTSSAATTTIIAPQNSQDSANSSATPGNPILSSPLWCIPESFFPGKKLDTLPPRPAQPLLHFSKFPSNLGSKSFDALQMIRMLHRLDQLITTNKKMLGQAAKCLHRDVYVCEWLSAEGGKPIQVSISGARSEYFPVFIQGAGRPTLAEESETYLNIGILHVPNHSSSLAAQSPSNSLSTLTLLPPEPHLLLPLLIRAAEIEHKILKRADAANNNQTNPAGGSTAGLIQKQVASSSVVPIDEHWRSEFRAYLFRLPPYYQHSLKRCLRPILPASVHSLLHTDDGEPLALHCFSKVCYQKIRNGEQVARDNSERQERQEASLGIRNQLHEVSAKDEKPVSVAYGHYDTRSSVDNYLAALRNLPPPWNVGLSKRQEGKSYQKQPETSSTKSVLDVLGDLPTECLMAFYESRRRWIFGGPGLSIRGLHVEGVRNDGTNTQRCSKPGEGEECALSIAGVGVSTLNRTSTTKMGEYKERLFFSRSPVVGYGSNDASGVAATTAVDGSPRWSVDDDALPLSFFDPKTGDFTDSAQARLRSRLQVNFGNPYKEKRADSLIPEKYMSQTPTRQNGAFGTVISSPRTPPTSPPHDSFDSVEEGEAIFVRASPARSSPKREDQEEPKPPPSLKRPRSKSCDDFEDQGSNTTDVKPKPPAPPAKKPSTVQPPSTNPDTSLPGEPSKQGATKPRPPKAPAPPKRPPPPKASSIVPLPPKPPQPKAPNPPNQAPQKPSASQAGPPKPPNPGQSQKPPTPQPPTATKLPSPPSHPSSKQTVAAKLGDKLASADSSLQQLRPPSSLSSDTAQASKNSLQTVKTVELELENPDVRPSVELPAGWISVWSKSKQRWYFFDQKTNKSVWNWPP